MTRHMARINRIGQVVLGIGGTLGALACTGAMVLAAIGVVGVSVAGVGSSAGRPGMVGMPGGTGTAPSGDSTSGGLSGTSTILVFLIWAGPAILVVSIGAIALGLALRRRAAAFPALLAGGLLYWGMYRQTSLAVMYGTIALGLVTWVALALWVRRRSPMPVRRMATYPSGGNQK